MNLKYELNKRIEPVYLEFSKSSQEKQELERTSLRFNSEKSTDENILAEEIDNEVEMVEDQNKLIEEINKKAFMHKKIDKYKLIVREYAEKRLVKNDSKITKINKIFEDFCKYCKNNKITILLPI